MISSVYPRCNNVERLKLWDGITSIFEENEMSWIIGCDFNVILNDEEKLGDLPFEQREAIGFALFIYNCAFSEVRHTENKYT